MLILLALLAHSVRARAGCIAFSEAKDHIGAEQCIRGRVLRVQDGQRGVTFLDFCEDYRVCSFTVVVFQRDLKQVGDVRGLAGKEIEIQGKIVLYDGRAEIILRRHTQLRGEAARLPPIPRDYDVEKRGRYSAGKFSFPDSSGKPARKKQSPSVPIEDPPVEGNDD